METMFTVVGVVLAYYILGLAILAAFTLMGKGFIYLIVKGVEYAKANKNL